MSYIAELLTRESRRDPDSELVQLRVFGFGFFQDGNVGVGVFPQRTSSVNSAATRANTFCWTISIRTARLLPVLSASWLGEILGEADGSHKRCLAWSSAS